MIDHALPGIAKIDPIDLEIALWEFIHGFNYLYRITWVIITSG